MLCILWRSGWVLALTPHEAERIKKHVWKRSLDFASLDQMCWWRCNCTRFRSVVRCEHELRLSGYAKNSSYILFVDLRVMNSRMRVLSIVAPGETTYLLETYLFLGGGVSGTVNDTKPAAEAWTSCVSALHASLVFGVDSHSCIE